MDSSTTKTPKQSATGLNVGTWMPAEDDRLREAVAKHGTRWVVVASEVGTRNGDQCAKRWNENLNPELDHSPWCPVEDRVLLHLVELHGHNWKFIANKFFEKRAPLSLKNRNSYLKRRQKREEQARASQRQTQSPTDPLPPNPALFTPGVMSIPDIPMGTPGPFPMTPEFSSPHGSPHSSSPSLTESDIARFASRTSSTTDFTEMYNTLAANTSAGQSPGSEAQHALLATSGVSMAETPLAYMSDQMTWPNLVDNSGTFSLTPDSDINMAMNAGFDDNRVPMLPMNEFAALQTQSPNPEDTVEYSLTCPRNKLKSLVQHLVDAAMPGTLALGIAEEDQQMVLNLRLKRL